MFYLILEVCLNKIENTIYNTGYIIIYNCIVSTYLVLYTWYSCYRYVVVCVPRGVPANSECLACMYTSCLLRVCCSCCGAACFCVCTPPARFSMRPAAGRSEIIHTLPLDKKPRRFPFLPSFLPSFLSSSLPSFLPSFLCGPSFFVRSFGIQP